MSMLMIRCLLIVCSSFLFSHALGTAPIQESTASCPLKDTQSGDAQPNEPAALNDIDKPIVLKNLLLYTLMLTLGSNINTLLKELLLAKGYRKEDQCELFAASRLASEGIKLMEDIVTGFNKGAFYYNPEIQYRFVSTCNSIENLDTIKPRHLRELSRQIKVFCNYVTQYCINRKEFLTGKDRDLSDKILNWSHILTLGLLQEKFLHMGLMDKIVDYGFFRPLEFIDENSGLIIVAVGIGAAISGYFFLKNA